MAVKKPYIKPAVVRVKLDSAISLILRSPPLNPPMKPRGDGSKGTDNPFASPFGDKPFS